MVEVAMGVVGMDVEVHGSVVEVLLLGEFPLETIRSLAVAKARPKNANRRIPGRGLATKMMEISTWIL